MGSIVCTMLPIQTLTITHPLFCSRQFWGDIKSPVDFLRDIQLLSGVDFTVFYRRAIRT